MDMYSVMIVEDEMLVRMGLMVSIPWDELDLQVVAEISNGAAALEAYRKYAPDIVITDVKLPGMNGLDLLSAIVQENGGCISIVVTCIDDFASIQRAMNLGAIGYLVKATMTREEMIHAVSKAVDMLKVQNRTSRVVTVPYKNKGIQTFFADGSTDLLPEFIPALAVIRLKKQGGISSILRRSIEGILRDRFAANDITDMRAENDEIIMLFKSEKEERMREIFCGLHDYLQEVFRVEMFVAFCLSDISKDSLRTLIGKLRECLKKEYLFDIPTLCFNNKGKFGDCVLQMQLQKVREEIWLLHDTMQVYEALCLLDALAMSQTQEWKKLQENVLKLAQMICTETARLQKFEAAALREKGIHGLVKLFLEDIFKQEIRSCEQSGRSEIRNAIRYMSNNLSHSISLQDAARAAGLHATYFSTIFKQQMKSGFSDYLNLMRIENAKSLLSEGDCTIQQVSDQCGFSDVSYFSRKFKQMTGVSPSIWKGREA